MCRCRRIIVARICSPTKLKGKLEKTKTSSYACWCFIESDYTRNIFCRSIGNFIKSNAAVSGPPNSLNLDKGPSHCRQPICILSTYFFPVGSASK